MFLFVDINMKGVFFLSPETTASGLRLKESHIYYHQIQGQLYITNTNCCDLIIWTKKDLQIVRIVKDPSWEENISKMLVFYFTKFINWFI